MEKHIAFCVNNEYADYIRPAIKSIIELHKNDKDSYIINILSDSISTKNRNRLKDLVKDIYNIKLLIHIIDDTKLNGLPTGTWTIHTWYRILLTDIIPLNVNKVLYLDADTLVLENLNDLFYIKMDNKSIAASIDYQNLFDYAFERCGYEKEKEYICAGIMMINLDYWREYGIAEKIIEWGINNNNKIKCPDQDAINFICRDSKIILPMKFGFMDCFVKNPIFRERGYENQINECLENPAIVHYNGCPPWYKEYQKHTLNFRWEEYNQMLVKPVRRCYQAKGILKYKIIIFKLISKFRSFFPSKNQFKNY